MKVKFTRLGAKLAKAQRKAKIAERRVASMLIQKSVNSEWKAYWRTTDPTERQRHKDEVGFIIQEAEEEGIAFVSP